MSTTLLYHFCLLMTGGVPLVGLTAMFLSGLPSRKPYGPVVG